MFRKLMKYYRRRPLEPHEIGIDREGGRFKIRRRRKDQIVPHPEDTQAFKEETKLDEGLFNLIKKPLGTATRNRGVGTPAGASGRLGNLARRSTNTDQTRKQGINSFRRPATGGTNIMNNNQSPSEKLIKKSYGTRMEDETTDAQAVSDANNPAITPPPSFETPEAPESDYSAIDAIIDAALAGRPADCAAAFNAEITNRLTDMVDNYKAGLARNMFNPQPPEEYPDEQPEDDESEGDVDDTEEPIEGNQ